MPSRGFVPPAETADGPLTWQLWSAAGRRCGVISAAGSNHVTDFVLTEQDDDAEQDGHQGAGAEARPRRERLGVAQLHVALAVA